MFYTTDEGCSSAIKTVTKEVTLYNLIDAVEEFLYLQKHVNEIPQRTVNSAFQL
jgi:hypothetical protein